MVSGAKPISGFRVELRHQEAQAASAKVCLNGELRSKIIKNPEAASIVMEKTPDRYAIGAGGRSIEVNRPPSASGKTRERDSLIEATFDTVINGTDPLRCLLYLYLNKPPVEDPLLLSLNSSSLPLAMKTPPYHET